VFSGGTWLIDFRREAALGIYSSDGDVGRRGHCLAAYPGRVSFGSIEGAYALWEDYVTAQKGMVNKLTMLGHVLSGLMFLRLLLNGKKRRQARPV